MINRAWLWIGLIGAGFGVGFPLSKWLFESGLDVWQLFIPRFVIGTTLILLLLGREDGLFDRPNWQRGALLGLVNVVATTILLTLATDMLPASIVGVMTAFIPTASVAAAHFLVAGERFVARLVPGLLIGAIGVMIFVLAGTDPDGSRLDSVGLFLSLAGVTMAGVGGALNRKYASQVGAVALAIPQFVTATVILTGIAIPLGGAALSAVTPEQWLGLAALGSVSTALPFYALLKASELTTAARVSTSGYLVPIIGAGSSILVLGEPITMEFVLAASLVASGVFLTAKADRSTLSIATERV